MSDQRSLRVALLICDHPPAAVVEAYGTYDQIYANWLRECYESYPATEGSRVVDISVDGFYVFHDEWPDLAQRCSGSYDGLIITGAPYSANDSEPAFIPKLISFIQVLVSDPAYSALKIMGFCFGHQAIAVACGGVVVEGDRGSELGVYAARVTREGKDFFRTTAGQADLEVACIQQLHEEHVPSAPPGFVTILSTDLYPVQAMARYPSSASTSSRRSQIVSVQGHPEYPAAMMQMFLDERTGYMHYPDEILKEARRRIADPAGALGRRAVGWGILRMLLDL